MFTPDADGNRLFGVLTNIPVQEFEMTIYARTGLLVWQSNDIAEQWDGTSNGQPLPQGVYTYHWRAKTRGRIRTGIGTVLLLR